MSERFRWPRAVQLIHWTVAALFFSNYFLVEGGEQYHEYSGWIILALIGLRLFYGLTFAPAPARIEDIKPSFSGIKRHLHELKTQQRGENGHNPMGAIAVWLMWIILALAAVTGWLQDTDFGFEHGVYEWHSMLVNGLYYFVGVHLLAVLITSWLTRRNLIKTML
ncbi:MULTISPECIES: cytochrome b/b6 domain-containing protein [unclassified Endozoicomonas]|uniref:cytochrome b/b6 domain-containing protein n=1 Tax=unclassified Endozoicomonas TaxID=2644528 RepID=UPI0021490A33|nr:MULTISPECIES: cytochrome b/b6 domain-containing protein [unclassified Endozoicomonas]